MAKTNEARCVLTLELFPDKWQIDIIEKRFKIMEHLKNSLIAKELRRLKNIERTKAYRNLMKAIAEADAKTQGKLFAERNKMLQDAGFREWAFKDDMTEMQKHFVKHVYSQVAHKAASDVWRAFDKVLFHNGKKIHFIKKGTLSSVACQEIKKGMDYRDGFFEWNGGGAKKSQIRLKIRVAEPENWYEKEMLQKSIKYLRIVRKWSKTRYKYYVQFTLVGPAVMKPRMIANGKRVGIDIGTSSAAVVSEDKAMLLELADRVKKNHEEKCELQRKMDRSRRIMNPENFKEDGTVKRGVKLRWEYSKNYLRLRAKVRELERKNADIRKYQHTCLVNYILSLGTEVYVEQMNFSGLQRKEKETTYDKKGRPNKKKRFGKSLANRAPAMLLTILEMKLKQYTGNELHRVNTLSFRASQYDHTSDTYKKKPLKERWAILSSGDRIQRDMYSAFLLMNSNPDMKSANQNLCSSTYSLFKKHHDICIEQLRNENRRYLSSFGI